MIDVKEIPVKGRYTAPYFLRIWLISFNTFIFLCCCTEPFTPAVTDVEHTLVVEGIITDQKEPYLVRLSRSRSLDNTSDIIETGAQVSVFDSKGRSFSFSEAEEGLYWSNPEDFQGLVGEAYHLEILLSSGRRYQSDTVLLKPAARIDSIYFKRDLRLTDVAGDTLDGIRILVDAQDSTGETKHYRFEWTETYEVRPTYSSYYVYDFSSNLIVQRDTLLNLCYRTNTSIDILLQDATHLSESRISEYELKFVSTEGYHLRSLYSIQVRQFTLDEKGYKYWSALEEMSESQGTVFDPVQYAVYGNVRSLDDPGEPVLGYFDASAVSLKRIYIGRGELAGLNYPRDPCINQLISPRPGTDDFLLFISFGYMIVDVVGALWAPPECADCREHGTLDRPDFWPR